MVSKNFLLLTTSLFIIYSCNTGSAKELNSKDNSLNNYKDSIESPGSACDPNLWKYVYDPERLQVLDKCKIVTGTIEETSADEDGDQHMLLKLDKGQKDLLTKKNKTKKGGDLVIEAVCINNITRKKALGACPGYVNHVQLPKVGDHVKVTGSYVIDSHNGWAEIHPITKIDLIK
ncbi:MAG: hypothetical protein M3004_08285 [Bacteroidota bacterium]|nr:hypothetical protein [Bacteroidota bacterium]